MREINKDLSVSTYTDESSAPSLGFSSSCFNGFDFSYSVNQSGFVRVVLEVEVLVRIKMS